MFLYLQDGTAFVWSSEGIYRRQNWHDLRSKHRICGSLIGSIASHPRQNDFPGLPMALMNEETALLIEKNIAQLVSLPGLIDPPDEKLKKNVKQVEERLAEEQCDALKKRKIEQLSQKIDIIASGKKKKMAAKGLPDVPIDKETLIKEEISKLPTLSPGHLLLHLPVEHTIQLDKIYHSIDDLFPSVLEGSGVLRYAVFKDIWDKGLYLTNGSKFGADFLVYPGDPVRFHAMYMIRCIPDSTLPFDPSTLVAYGRLAVAVNKLAVLAAFDTQRHIKYQTLQWHESING